MLRLGIEAAQAGWVAQTYITEDTEALDARATQQVIEAIARYAKEAAAYNNIQVAADARRQLDLLKLSLVMVTPVRSRRVDRADAGLPRACAAPTAAASGAPIASKPQSCMNIDDITKVMAESRSEPELRRVWEGWHTVSPPMRKDYARFVELSNKGAKELGFVDTGAMWRQKYDMPADDFTKELDRLWEQVRPLYVKLHAYIRMKLRAKYGDAVPQDGPLPAHLLGNIWAQDWSNVYPLVAPANGRCRLLADRHPEAPQDRRDRHGEDRRAVLYLARVRAAPRDLLAAVALRAAAGPRSRLPRQRLGHRLGRRCPHQDVHPADRGRLQYHPPRARAQLLPARLQGPAGHLPRQRERRFPRSDRRRDRALGDAGVPGADRPARQGSGYFARHRAVDGAGAREGRVSAVRPPDRSVALESVRRRGAAGRITTRRGGICA